MARGELLKVSLVRFIEFFAPCNYFFLLRKFGLLLPMGDLPLNFAKTRSVYSGLLTVKEGSYGWFITIGS